MKILLAVDGSKHSQWAEALLGKIGGRGHSVEVLTVAPAVIRGADGEQSITEALRDSGHKMVRAVAKGLPKRFSTSTAVIESHDVAGAVLDRAKKTRADLIVMGARGLSPFKTFFLGSVSHKVSRHADCSVLVAHRRPGRGLKVLAAVDGSPASRRATAFLSEVGVPASADLTLLHVVAEPLGFWIPETGFPGGYGNLAAFEESLKALRQRGERVLVDAKKEAGGRFGRVRTLLREGYPVSEIVRAAKSAKATCSSSGEGAIRNWNDFSWGACLRKYPLTRPARC
jgi:nucleotide-binding universal stress UspA family protein